MKYFSALSAAVAELVTAANVLEIKRSLCDNLEVKYETFAVTSFARAQLPNFKLLFVVIKMET